MAWLPVDQTVMTHRKTLALATKLGIGPPAVVGHLVFLWLWALDNAPDGNLTKIEPETVARAAQYHVNDVGANRGSVSFFDALVSTGFVDKRGHGEGRLTEYRIHDWKEYGGKWCKARAANRARMQRARAALDRDRDRDRDNNE